MWPHIAAADTFRILQDFSNGDARGSFRLPDIPTRSRRGILVEDSSAAIYGQKIARISIPIKRVGDAQGPVNCKIWDSSGTEVANMGSVDSANLNVQGDGTTFTKNLKTFTNQNNQYVMQIGDVIGLEYPGAGIDEDEGDRDDFIIIARWMWNGQSEA